MALATSKAFLEFEDIQTRLNRLFGRGMLQASAREVACGDWEPPADAQETDLNYLIKIYCPYVTPDDVQVTLQDGVLTIEGRGARTPTVSLSNTIAPGVRRFVRRFTLPRTIEATKVQAELTGGVLTIQLPKVPNPRSRTVHVRVAQGSPS